MSAFNRTIQELKPDDNNPNDAGAGAFNRTIQELKLDGIDDGTGILAYF